MSKELKDGAWKTGQSLDDGLSENEIEIIDDAGIVHAIACDIETAKQITEAVNSYASSQALIQELKEAATEALHVLTSQYCSISAPVCLQLKDALSHAKEAGF